MNLLSAEELVAWLLEENVLVSKPKALAFFICPHCVVQCLLRMGWTKRKCAVACTSCRRRRKQNKKISNSGRAFPARWMREERGGWPFWSRPPLPCGFRIGSAFSRLNYLMFQTCNGYNDVTRSRDFCVATSETFMGNFQIWIPFLFKKPRGLRQYLFVYLSLSEISLFI